MQRGGEYAERLCRASRGPRRSPCCLNARPPKRHKRPSSKHQAVYLHQYQYLVVGLCRKASCWPHLGLLQGRSACLHSSADRSVAAPATREGYYVPTVHLKHVSGTLRRACMQLLQMCRQLVQSNAAKARGSTWYLAASLAIQTQFKSPVHHSKFEIKGSEHPGPMPGGPGCLDIKWHPCLFMGTLQSYLTVHPISLRSDLTASS